MNTHVGVNDGFVSSDRDSEIQGSRSQGAVLEQHVCNTLSWSEHRVIKRNKSQLRGRKLDDPSAPERRVSAYLVNSTGRERRGIFCCLAVLKCYMNCCVGTVLGETMQIGVISCRDGNTEACSSLG